MPKLLTRVVAIVLLPCLAWGDLALRTSDFGIKSDIRIPPSEIHFASQTLANREISFTGKDAPVHERILEFSSIPRLRLTRPITEWTLNYWAFFGTKWQRRLARDSNRWLGRVVIETFGLRTVKEPVSPNARPDQVRWRSRMLSFLSGLVLTAFSLQVVTLAAIVLYPFRDLSSELAWVMAAFLPVIVVAQGWFVADHDNSESPVAQVLVRSVGVLLLNVIAFAPPLVARSYWDSAEPGITFINSVLLQTLLSSFLGFATSFMVHLLWNNHFPPKFKLSRSGNGKNLTAAMPPAQLLLDAARRYRDRITSAIDALKTQGLTYTSKDVAEKLGIKYDTLAVDAIRVGLKLEALQRGEEGGPESTEIGQKILDIVLTPAGSSADDNQTFDTDIAKGFVERMLHRAHRDWNARAIADRQKIWVPILEQGVFVTIALFARWHYGADTGLDIRSGSWIPWLIGLLYGYLHKIGFTKGERVLRGIIGMAVISMYLTGGTNLVIASVLVTLAMIAFNFGYPKRLWREINRRVRRVGEVLMLKGLSLLALAAVIWLTRPNPWEWADVEWASLSIMSLIIAATLAAFIVAGLMEKLFPYRESVYLPIRRGGFGVPAFYAVLWAVILPGLLFGPSRPHGLLPVFAAGSMALWGLYFSWRMIRERLSFNPYRRFKLTFTRYRRIYIPAVDRWSGILFGFAMLVHAVAWVLGLRGPWIPLPRDIDIGPLTVPVTHWTPTVPWEMLMSIAFQAGFVLWCVNRVTPIANGVKLPRRYEKIMRRLFNLGRALLTGWFLFVLPGAVVGNLLAAYTDERLPYQLLHMDWLFGRGHPGDLSDLYYASGLTLLAMATSLALLFGEYSDDNGSGEGSGRGSGPTTSFTFEFTTKTLEARTRQHPEVRALIPVGPGREQNDLSLRAA